MKIKLTSTVVAVLFCLLLGLPTSAQDLREMQVSEVPPAEQKQVVVLDPNESILVVYSTLPDISFDSNLGIIRPEEPFPGIYYLHLNPGTNMITFQAKGFLSLQQTIYIDRKQSKQVKVTAAAGIISGRGSLRLETEPSGATVVMNNITLKDRTPFTLENQPAGVHSFRFQLEGYIPIDTLLTVAKDKVSSHQIRLRRAFAGLRVNSDPSGAAVFLDGDSLGLTPLTRDDLKPGEGTLLIQLEGYINSLQPIRLSVGTPSVINGYLVRQSGSAEIVVSPTGAEVFLDGLSLGTYKGSPILADKLNVGPHTLRAVLEGYGDRTVTFNVAFNKSEKVEVRLKGDPGSLFVISNPSGATILLDGQPTGKKTPYKLNEVASGDHDLALRLDGYADITRTITVLPGRTETVNETLSGSTLQPAIRNEIKSPTRTGLSVQDIKFRHDRTRWGFQIGLNIARIAGDDGYNESTSPYLGLVIGTFFQFPLNGHWSIQTEFYYSMKGDKWEDYSYDEYGYSNLITGEDVLGYLEIPILFKVKFGKNYESANWVKWNISFGPALNFLVHAHGTASYFPGPYDLKKYVNTLDISVIAGYGLEYKAFTFDTRLDLGLMNIWKEGGYPSYPIFNRNRVVSFLIGFNTTL